MQKKISILVILIISLTVAAVQAKDYEGSRDNLPGLKVGSKAPDFQLKTLEGDTVRLSDFKGQKIMLNFWATWCPPCRAEMPDMQKFYSESQGQIKILAVNIDPENNVSKYVKEMKLNFPILLDKDEEVSNKYQILSIPTTYFLDEKGVIKKKRIGAMSFKEMKEYTDEIR